MWVGGLVVDNGSSTAFVFALIPVIGYLLIRPTLRPHYPAYMVTSALRQEKIGIFELGICTF